MKAAIRKRVQAKPELQIRQHATAANALARTRGRECGREALSDETTARPEGSAVERPEPLPRISHRGHQRTRVHLVLDEGASADVVGLVYGLEHVIGAPGYRARILLDSYNRRVKVLEYRATDYEAMILKLRFLAQANRFDKIWVKATARDWQEFLKHGYVLEGVLKYFNRGRPAFLVSKFRSQRRLHSRELMKEILLIEKIMARPVTGERRTLPDGYALDFARESDVDAMVAVYREVFKTYPSPLSFPEYLLSVMHRGAIFRVVRKGGVPVAIASAELDRAHLAAELTDCATRPEERGRGLISVILGALESDLHQRGYRCAFSLARSRSLGINAAFHSLGYEFNGRLVNNCNIAGDFEDMNLWVKDLRQAR